MSKIVRMMQAWIVILIASYFVPAKNFADTNVPSSVGGTSCSNIVGIYDFWGVINVNGKNTRISFLQRLIRPSRPDIQSVRIVSGNRSGEFSLTFLSAGGDIVGDDVLVTSSCNSGKWEESESYEGYSDGTVVRETRAWRYSRDGIGS